MIGGGGEENLGGGRRGYVWLLRGGPCFVTKQLQLFSTVKISTHTFAPYALNI